MKAYNRTHCLLLASLLSLVVSLRGAVAEITFERHCLAAPHVNRPITIDGDERDWPIEADRATMALDPDSDQFSGNARVCWDEKYLYLIYSVAAGNLMRNAGGDPSVAYKTGDTVEAFLCVSPNPLTDRPTRQPALDTNKEGDYRVLMTMLRSTTPVVFGYDFVNPTNAKNPLIVKVSGPTAYIDVAGAIDGADLVVKGAKVKGINGYLAEARIPWAYFRNYKPRLGDRLLFDLAINFANGAGNGNMGKCYWNGPGGMVTDAGVEGQIHPDEWGWLVLK